MEINFIKYHGTGNDFVIIDQFTTEEYDLSESQITMLCSRRFGIGADGLMIIRQHDTTDFEMIYYNSDGRTSSMCGNGGRCIVQYAHTSGYIKESCSFMAIDGIHSAEVLGSKISLEMTDLKDVLVRNDGYVLDTGSPHFVMQAEHNLPQEEFITEAKKIRYSPDFKIEGINVNSFEYAGENYIRGITYERGVEDITYSCGTGVVAMAIVHAIRSELEGRQQVEVENIGGRLAVSFFRTGNSFSDIRLIGPAVKVFSGTFSELS